MNKKNKPQLPKIAKVPAMAFWLLTDITKDGPSKSNYKGSIIELENHESLEVWENKMGVRYEMSSIPYGLLFKDRWQYPNFGVGQDMMFKMLIALCEKQNKGKENKEPIIQVSLSDIARYMGESEENIKKGSRYLDKYKHLLFSGLHTVIKYKTTYNKKPYTWHGAIWSIGEPDDGSTDFLIEFNSQLGRDIVKGLHGELKGFYRVYVRELRDLKARRRPYLHRFYSWLMFMNRKSGTTIPMKAINLIKAIKDDKNLQSRPKNCYELLMECFTYIGENYPEDLKRVTFYNSKDRSKSIEFEITDHYKNMSYKDFKSWLKAGTGLKDIREALISCKSDRRTRKKQLTDKENQLINRIMAWVENYEKVTNTQIKFNSEDRISFIGYCLKKMGHDSLEGLFEKEANKENPNAIEFLTKVLPGELKNPGEHIKWTGPAVKYV
jgi:hypothetical protein